MDGSPVCWGRNLGFNQIDIPEEYKTQNFRTIDAGCYHTCAIREDDQKLRCWGSDIKGGYSSGDGTYYVVDSVSGQSTVPDPHQPYRAVTGASHYTCALTEPDGAIQCWCVR